MMEKKSHVMKENQMQFRKVKPRTQLAAVKKEETISSEGGGTQNTGNCNEGGRNHLQKLRKETNHISRRSKFQLQSRNGCMTSFSGRKRTYLQ